MKLILISLLAAGALVGCNNPDRDLVEQNKDATKDQLNAQKHEVDQAADAARARADAENKADKARITAQEKAQKAQIEADKEKTEAIADAQKKVIDAQEDAAKGAPAAVESGTATSNQTLQGRITSLNSVAGTLALTDANGTHEFKLVKRELAANLKEGDTVAVKYYERNGSKVVESVDVKAQK